MDNTQKPRVVIDIEDLRTASGQSEEAAQPEGVNGGTNFFLSPLFQPPAILAELRAINPLVLAASSTVMCPW
jgi:hypothetical protein